MLSVAVLTCVLTSLRVSAVPGVAATHGLTSNPSLFAAQPFDYVIVGGGTAGLVLANRLSANTKVKVGVIEAGILRFPDPLIDTPGDFGIALGNPNYDWNFTTVPQTHIGGRQVVTARGKVLGGSSALNGMAWQRASSQEYDAIHTLGADSSWSWLGFLPLFKRVESLVQGPVGIASQSKIPPGSDNLVEGRTGPIQSGYNNFIADPETAWIETLQAAGMKINPDPDAGDATGSFFSARSVGVSTGNRSYSASDYLIPVLGRPNLLVLTNAQATEVMFKSKPGATFTATGVKYSSGGTTFTVSAAKEVILSAGSIQTPQLLELSGIGNATRLHSLGIPSKLDIPVIGENLQDQIAILAAYPLTSNSTITLNTLTTNATFAAQQQQLYMTKHTGAITHTPAFLTWGTLKDIMSPSDAEALIASAASEIASAHGTSAFYKKQAAIQLDLLKAGKVGQWEILMNPLTPKAGVNAITIYSVQTKPFTRGSVHVTSTDPLAAPAIDQNFLQYNFDLQLLTKVLQFVLKTAQTGPLKSLIGDPILPTLNSSVADLQSFIKANLFTAFHPIGTAPLGIKGDGAVDSTLTVYGTTNLRVVDASVIPFQMSTHPQQTIYAIAEKAADMILSSC